MTAAQSECRPVLARLRVSRRDGDPSDGDGEGRGTIAEPCRAYELDALPPGLSSRGPAATVRVEDEVTCGVGSQRGGVEFPARGVPRLVLVRPGGLRPAQCTRGEP